MCFLFFAFAFAFTYGRRGVEPARTEDVERGGDAPFETVRMLVRVSVTDHAVRGGSRAARAGARGEERLAGGVRCARENGQCAEVEGCFAR